MESKRESYVCHVSNKATPKNVSTAETKLLVSNLDWRSILNSNFAQILDVLDHS